VEVAGGWRRLHNEELHNFMNIWYNEFGLGPLAFSDSE
jgi:hypothetical protein